MCLCFHFQGWSSHSSPRRMDDEEDDVFEPDSSCWRSTFREIKCKDQGTQTPGPALAPHSGMLPCGVAEEPRPLFYGEACSDPKEKKGTRS